MRVLFVVPPVAAFTGNVRTVERLVGGLEARGHTAVACPVDAAQRLAQVAAELRPDVVQIYHAFRAACPRDFADRGRRPLRILTFAGSDLPDLPVAQAHHDVIAAEVGRADAAMVALAEQRTAVARAWPTLAGRVFVVPKGVVAPPVGDFPLRRRASCFGDELLALLPASIRPVKRNLLAIGWFADVTLAEPRARLLLVGPVVDPEYARAVRSALATAPHACWLGALSWPELGAALRAAAAVVNVSAYEGQSNALLEAMALGRPVVAADGPGNREWLKDGENALVFGDRAGFVLRVVRALRGGVEVERIAERGRAGVERDHSAAAEIDALLELYRFAADHPRAGG